MKELYFTVGMSIEDAISFLNDNAKKYGYECYGVFNGKEIFSSETEDQIYKKITGNNKDEFNRKLEEDIAEHKRIEIEFKRKIPFLITEYIRKADGVIPVENIPLWNKIVPIRLNDIYRGMELDCWLDLIKIMNSDETDEKIMVQCETLFNEQGHSGMSASLVLRGLEELHSKGKIVSDYIKKIEL